MVFLFVWIDAFEGGHFQGTGHGENIGQGKSKIKYPTRLIRPLFVRAK